MKILDSYSDKYIYLNAICLYCRLYRLNPVSWSVLESSYLCHLFRL